MLSIKIPWVQLHTGQNLNSRSGHTLPTAVDPHLSLLKKYEKQIFLTNVVVKSERTKLKPLYLLPLPCSRGFFFRCVKREIGTYHLFGLLPRNKMNYSLFVYLLGCCFVLFFL